MALSNIKTPCLNSILRYGKFTQLASLPSSFMARFLRNGSLISHAKNQLSIDAKQSAVFVTPLWQRMGMNHVDTLDAIDIGIAYNEAKLLCEGLNQFYEDAHFKFYALTENLWVATLPKEPDWNVPPVYDALGSITGEQKAEGKDKSQWFALQTEIQMWLNQHSSNIKRQENNLPTINGIWLWQDIIGSFDKSVSLTSNHTLAQLHTGKKFIMTDHFSSWKDQIVNDQSFTSEYIIFFNQLTSILNTGNIFAYTAEIEHLENNWFAPIWEAMMKNEVKRLNITTDGDNGGNLTITKKSIYVFWKKKKTFEGILY